MYNDLNNLKVLVGFEPDLIGLSDEIKITEDNVEISIWERHLKNTAKAVSSFIDEYAIEGDLENPGTTDYDKSLAELELVKAEILKEASVYSMTEALEISVGGSTGQKIKQRQVKPEELEIKLQSYYAKAYKFLTGQDYSSFIVGLEL